MASAVSISPTTKRSGRIAAISVATGILIGLVVAVFELVVKFIEHGIEDQPIGIRAALPFVGLAIAAAILRFSGDLTPSTSEDYIKAYHARQPELPLRPLPARLAAGVSTVASGGALGLEGPAIYAGSTIGFNLQKRVASVFTRDETKVLMAAGAAAGVAAIFKTPATGVLFALESPYKRDLGPRALTPALLASAASYTTYVTLLDRDPVLEIAGTRPEFESRAIVGALAVGILAGLGAALYARLMGAAKALKKYPVSARIAMAGVVLAVLAVVSNNIFGEPLTLGPGYEAANWVTESPERDIGLVALLFLFRLAATFTSIGAGGTGGLFIPLAVQGTILGRLVGIVLGRGSQELFPILGLAAFLGAGYRTPMASTMFVAETTRGLEFVVPALIAAAVSQVVVGNASVSSEQRDERLGHLEKRFSLKVTELINTDVGTVPPDATIGEFMAYHALGRRQLIVPVVDGDSNYVGMCLVDDVGEIERDQWDETQITEIMRTDLETVPPSANLREALVAMEKHHVSVVAVTDTTGFFVGVVSDEEIVRMDEILDETEG